MMLKRQRQPTPPPTTSSIPLISSDPAPDAADERNAKRRRTQPPVLDGALRGWAKPDFDDDEDEYSEEELEDYGARFGNRRSDGHINATLSESGEYKSTNSMLRDLHALHQHRLLFSSPSSPAAPVHVPHNQPSFSNHYSSPSPTKNPHLPPQQMQTAYASLQKMGLHDGRISEEAEVVAEHYENTNKLLGSLFLSRRRALDTPSDDFAHR